jgi:putative transposase
MALSTTTAHTMPSSTSSVRVMAVSNIANVSWNFVRGPSGRFVEARYRNLGWPAITMSEQKAAIRQLKVRGRREIDET